MGSVCPNHIALCDQWCLCLAGSCAMQAALYLLVPCVVFRFDSSNLFPSSCCICCRYLVVGVDRLCGSHCVHCALALLQQHCSQLLCDLTLSFCHDVAWTCQEPQHHKSLLQIILYKHHAVWVGSNIPNNICMLRSLKLAAAQGSESKG